MLTESTEHSEYIKYNSGHKSVTNLSMRLACFLRVREKSIFMSPFPDAIKYNLMKKL